MLCNLKLQREHFPFPFGFGQSGQLAFLADVGKGRQPMRRRRLTSLLRASSDGPSCHRHGDSPGRPSETLGSTRLRDEPLGHLRGRAVRPDWGRTNTRTWPMRPSGFRGSTSTTIPAGGIQLGALLDNQPRPGAMMAAGYTLLGVEVQLRSYGPLAATFAAHAKLRIPVGFLGYELTH